MRREAIAVSVMVFVSLGSTVAEAQRLEPVPATAEWKAALEKRVPRTARCRPKSRRRVLLFSLTTGFDHWVIPHTNEVVTLLGRKTGAFEVVQSTDIAMFESGRLEAFDGIVLNNNCSRGPRRNLFLDVLGDDEARAASLERNLLEFVRGGKGITVLHGAIVCLNNSPEFSAMLGGSFDFHPAQQEVVLNLVEPDHPLLEAFEGRPLVHIDEPYLFKNAYARKDFRPLLVMDTGKLDGGNRQAQVASDVRYCAWIRKHGEGRVFYCSPSHNAQSYDDARLLRFLLDGIQYTLGDLVCDDSVRKPSTK